MTETDKEFVERITSNSPSQWGLRDVRRLRAIALRGAETQWRPERLVELEYGTEVLAFDVRGKKDRQAYGPFVAWLGSTGYVGNDGDQVRVTHVIPLTALGEPDDQH